MNSEGKKPRHSVQAPQPHGPLPPNRVVRVDLAEDEEVEWTWSTLPNGERYVSGYSIRKKRE